MVDKKKEDLELSKSSFIVFLPCERVLWRDFCAKRRSESAVCRAQMKNSLSEFWCKKHPQGTLAYTKASESTSSTVLT